MVPERWGLRFRWGHHVTCIPSSADRVPGIFLPIELSSFIPWPESMIKQRWVAFFIKGGGKEFTPSDYLYQSMKCIFFLKFQIPCFISRGSFSNFPLIEWYVLSNYRIEPLIFVLEDQISKEAGLLNDSRAILLAKALILRSDVCFLVFSLRLFIGRKDWPGDSPSPVSAGLGSRQELLCAPRRAQKKYTDQWRKKKKKETEDFSKKIYLINEVI